MLAQFFPDMTKCHELRLVSIGANTLALEKIVRKYHRNAKNLLTFEIFGPMFVSARRA